VIAGFAGRPTSFGTSFAPSSVPYGVEMILPGPYRRRRRLADYVTVATLALPPPGNDSDERLEKAEGLAAAVRLYAEVFEADPGGDPEVVHRFARMLLALEDFELAGLCLEQQLERQVQIERHRRLVAIEYER
jgi:hypothetical protein